MNIESTLANPTRLRALTTLEPTEFVALRKPFERAFLQARKMYRLNGKRRRKPLSPKRLESPTKTLPTIEHKLLFILMALKTDAIQHQLGVSFDLSQTTVSKWYRYLLPVLDKTLKRLGHQPARSLEGLAAELRSTSQDDDQPGEGGGGLRFRPQRSVDETAARSAEAQEAEQVQTSLHLDVTVRAVPRNHDARAQRHDYDGKSGQHVVKNSVICDAGQRICYLGPTWRGAIHDKRMADEELPDLSILKPWDLWLTLDSGYLAYQPKGVHLLSTQRARRNRPLAEWQKEMNRWVGSVRIVVEHAIGGMKRLAKATRARVHDLAQADVIMQIAAGLQNLRVASRQKNYAVSHARTNARLHPFAG